MLAEQLSTALHESPKNAEDWAREIGAAVPGVKVRVESQRGLAGDVILIIHGELGNNSVIRIGISKKPEWMHGQPPPPKVKVSYQMGRLHIPTKNGPIEKVVAHAIKWLGKQDL